MEKQKRVILGVTGSIAAYKAADIIRGLMAAGLRVSVVMTQEAERFITPLTLASLSGEKVYRKMFGKQEDTDGILHITLAREADALLIAPATANIIGKISNGIADDLLTCIAMASKGPVLIAPAMNTDMYENKVVQENCRKLEKNGAELIGPVKGKLACGTTGLGHLADVKMIIEAVLQAVKRI